MTEEKNHPKKVPVTTYKLGSENYFMVYPTVKGYHCSGKIAGTRIAEDAETMEEIYSSITKQLDLARLNYLTDAITLEEVSLRIKENIQSEENPLEKLTKDMGGEVKQRK